MRRSVLLLTTFAASALGLSVPISAVPEPDVLAYQVPDDRSQTDSHAAASGSATGSEAWFPLVGSTTDNSTRYPLGRASFTAGRLYIAFLSLSEASGAVDSTPGIVGTDTEWTKIDAGEASIAKVGLTAYSFQATADSTDVELQTDTLSAVHEGLWYSIVEVTSSLPEAPRVTQYSAGATGRATGYARTLGRAPSPDSLVLGSFVHAANEPSAPSNGWTELTGTDLGHATPPRGAHVIYDDTAADLSAGSAWATSTPSRGVVVEIPASTVTPSPTKVTLAGAGDLCGGCGNSSNRVMSTKPDVVVTMGDLAYPNGLLSEYQSKYGGGTQPATRWGRPAIKDITLPGYGNHDCFDVPRATGATKQGCDGAVAYFGADSVFGTDIPGTPGSYHTVINDWLIVHLNSAGDVGTGQATAGELSAQNSALEEILASDNHACEIVVWHHPRYSGGEHGSNLFVDSWFDTAYANGVDIVLNGHDHDYERFAPQDGNGNAVSDGVREFVVGTGGASVRPIQTVLPNSEVRIVDGGILAMDLMNNGSYSWRFLDTLSGASEDTGSGSCHA